LTGPPGVLKSDAMQTADMITKKLPGGQTHFRVYIVSEAFKGKTRLERHRMINATLAGEMAGGVHALAIHAVAPGEGGA
jgi:BolA protein